MRVYVADAHVQRLVSVVKMATVVEECSTEEQRSVMRFCGQKDSTQRTFIKRCFLFAVGSVCRVKRFTTVGKRSADDEEVETEVWKWLRQQSKDFYAAGFDTLVKRRDKCISVWRRICREIKVFSGLNIICFTFYIHL
jgi:hypothetical protein